MAVEWARPARPDDASAIAALGAVARAEVATERGGALWVVHEGRRPVPPLDDPDGCVLVGGIDSDDGTAVVFGYLAAAIEPLGDGSRIAVVRELYVEPDARGVGVGEALMDAAIAWARQRGCRGIDALVLPGMRDSKNFFERFGLTARAIAVHRALPEP